MLRNFERTRCFKIPPCVNNVTKILSDGDTSGDFDEISNGRASSAALSMSPPRWAGTGRVGHLQPGGSSAVSERPPTTTWRVIVFWLSWILLEEKCEGLKTSVCAEGLEAQRSAHPRTPPSAFSQSRTATTTAVCLSARLSSAPPCARRNAQ